MFRWFNQGGFQVDVATLRRACPRLQMRTLEAWLHEEGWAGRGAFAPSGSGSSRGRRLSPASIQPGHSIRPREGRYAIREPIAASWSGRSSTTPSSSSSNAEHEHLGADGTDLARGEVDHRDHEAALQRLT